MRSLCWQRIVIKCIAMAFSFISSVGTKTEDINEGGHLDLFNKAKVKIRFG